MDFGLASFLGHVEFCWLATDHRDGMFEEAGSVPIVLLLLLWKEAASEETVVAVSMDVGVVVSSRLVLLFTEKSTPMARMNSETICLFRTILRDFGS